MTTTKSNDRWLQVWLISFSSILLAEIGDKTQLATLLLSARFQTPLITFLAAAAALICTSLIGVLCGRAVARVCPPRVIKIVAGIGFVGVGSVILWSNLLGSGAS